MTKFSPDELRHNESLRRILDSLIDYIVVTDVNLDIIYLNKKFVEKGSVDSIESTIGRPFYDVFNTFRYEEDFQAAFSAARRQGISQYIPRLEHKTQMGEMKFYKVSISPIKNDGEILGYAFIFESLTDVVEEEKVNTLVVDALIHYLSNVLNNMAASLVAYDLTHDINLVYNLSTEIKRMRKLIENLYFLKSKGKVLPMERLYFSRILSKIFEYPKYKNASKVKVNIDIEPNLGIYGNSEQVERVLETVIDNAYDAMQNEGVLTIQGFQTEKEITIRITNTGPPIQSEVLESLKQGIPFVSTKAKSGRGLGIGFFLSKKILEYVYEGEMIPTNLEGFVEILLIFRGEAVKRLFSNDS